MAVVTAFDIFGRGLNMADVALTQWMLDGPATPPANLAHGVGVGVNVTVGIGLDARFQMNVDAAPISRFRFTVTTDADGNWTIIRFESTDAGRAQLVTLEGIALATEKGQLSASVLMADFLTGNDTITGNRFSDVLRGSEGNDILFGGLGGDVLRGDAGDDTLDGGSGSNVLIGGAGTDVAILGSRAESSVFTAGDWTLVVGRDGVDALHGVEFVRFGSDAAIPLATFLADAPVSTRSFAVTDTTTMEASTRSASAYSGPVDHLVLAFLGSHGGEAIAGTQFADFINALGGDDAVDAGQGADVVDGGTGSNFISGGADRDVFFLDGRSGSTTWSTITDWENGEQLSVWGWRPGVSATIWVDRAGAVGFEGTTMHVDLDGNGSVEMSVTWTGKTQSALPSPLHFDGLLWFT